jgi:hypothetical protein
VREEAARVVTRRAAPSSSSAAAPGASASWLEPTERDAENEACLGGLRSPWKAVRKIPSLRRAGTLIRSVISKFVDEHPAVITDLLTKRAAGWAVHKDNVEGKLVPRLAAALGTNCFTRGPGSKWRPGLVKAFVEMAGDAERDLSTWLAEGAPTGVSREITACGVFPKVETSVGAAQELQQLYAQAGNFVNYTSVTDNKDKVRAELERLTQLGFVSRHASLLELRQDLPEFVVNKMACVLKEKDDGSVKLRLITDMRRSGVNAHVKLHERIVLPRLCDAVADLLSLLELPGDGDNGVEMMVSDFADAFHSMGVHPSERKHQVLAGVDGDFVVYETVVFGGGGSPLVWGRAAAFLSRSGQSMFEEGEMKLELFVDDPWSAWRGTKTMRERNMVTLLLWWLACGLDISWHKIEKGSSVKWIGGTVSVLQGKLVSVSIPQRFADELAKECADILSKSTVAVRRLRCLAGKASWAGGLVPCVASMLQPLWAALADVRTTHARHCARSSWRSKADEELHLPTVRVSHALEWLYAFSTQKRGTLTRMYSVTQHRQRVAVTLTFDASPWGYGGYLEYRGRCIAWFSEPISQEDIDKFGITVGDARYQALLENLAILFGVRAWLPLWQTERAAIVVRSDSLAALGAWRKERSNNPHISAVVREMSLDMAEGRYKLDVLEHLPGSVNEWADNLSRQFAPGYSLPVPPPLLAASRTALPKRDQSYWLLAARPADGIIGHHEAYQ